MRFFLTVALLAFAWQIAPLESVVLSQIHDNAEHTIRDCPDLADSVFVLSAAEGASFLPIADSQSSPRTECPALSGEVLEAPKKPFGVLSAGIISGLSPPLS